jgi:hypothetical protein
LDDANLLLVLLLLLLPPLLDAIPEAGIVANAYTEGEEMTLNAKKKKFMILL